MKLSGQLWVGLVPPILLHRPIIEIKWRREKWFMSSLQKGWDKKNAWIERRLAAPTAGKIKNMCNVSTPEQYLSSKRGTPKEQNFKGKGGGGRACMQPNINVDFGSRKLVAKPKKTATKCLF